MEGEEGRVKVVLSSLGKVSVVQIERAVVSQESCVDEREQKPVGIPWRIFWIGRRWPITPVDITRVEEGEERQASTAEAMAWASSRPPLPVTAFAQPAFITTARIPSPPRDWRVERLTVTGAAWNLFLVKTAAAEQGVEEEIRARSGKRVFEALTPTWVPETEKPLG